MVAPGFWANLRALVAPLSPRRRRWKRFLRDLALDPELLPRPLAPPGADDFIICGAPRTGTTLLAAALFQPPRIVTVMEPWDGMRLPPAELFASLRDEIDSRASLSRGKLDVETLLNSGRVAWNAEGSTSVPVRMEERYLLGVKWPAYWRYLDLLPQTKFLVCLRHPAEVVNSFQKKGGRLEQGLEYDIAFNRKLNERLAAAASDSIARRAWLYELVHRQILPHLSRPNVLAIRYERWFLDPDALIREIGDFLGAHLSRGPAAVRPSARQAQLNPDDHAAVARICRSAEALGYRLDAAPQ